MNNKIEANSERGFDCVKMMREIRNKMDAKFATMNWEEQKAFIKRLNSGEEKL